MAVSDQPLSANAATSATAPRPRHRVTPGERGETLAAFAFLLPNIVGFLLFTFVAAVASLGIALTNWNLLSPPTFVGLANFGRVATDPDFRVVLGNTLYFVAGTVPLSMALALAVALALNTKLRGLAILRSVYFLPVITPTVVIALVWRWFYNPDFGILNDILRAVGVRSPPNWLSDFRWAMPSIILMSVWKSLGYNMIVFLAGLQAIPAELYEAASIDGAGRWAKFRHVTLPMLTPTTFFVLITSVIGSFQVFDQVVVLTEGGPAGTTRSIVYYLWQQAFAFLRMGYGAAIAWALFGIIFLVTALQWGLQRRWVHYEVE